MLSLLMIYSCTQKPINSSQIQKKQIDSLSINKIEPFDTETIEIISVKTIDSVYNEAFYEIKNMLISSNYDFKRAIFLSENAYFNDSLKYENFKKDISQLVMLCNLSAKNSKLLYNLSDSSKVIKYASVFKLMTDGIWFAKSDSTLLQFPPYIYDFEDFAGDKDWSNMFVSKLIKTHRGNCHSLPFLYKILVEELGENAFLALAPNHIYIKQQNKTNGWYNTELTSGMFPNDAWLMASGYIKLEAIQNGIYMKPLDQSQSIALCLIDLAHGYHRKIGFKDGLFILKCCNLALSYYPNYINALLFKAETQKTIFEGIMKEAKVNYPAEVFNDFKAKSVFDEMNSTYALIHKLGYRKMPNDMYSNWLVSLKEEKEKFQNKNIKFKASNSLSK